MTVHAIRLDYMHPVGLEIYEVKWQFPRGQEGEIDLCHFQPTNCKLQLL